MAHVDHFSWQTDHLKAAVIAESLRVTFEDEMNTNKVIWVAEKSKLWLAKPLSLCTDITWLDRAELAIILWWKISIKVQEEDTLFIHQATINAHKTALRFILVILYNDENIYIL